MATITNHGGNCCGMRHIHGFYNGRVQDLRELTDLTSRYSIGTRYQLEVILSDAQTRDGPALVAELARLGYVYTSSWSGNHETPVHLFLRAHTRLALSNAHFYNRWVNDLNGQLPHPDLGGVLPPIGRNAVVADPPPLAVGDRVLVLRGTRQGHRGTVHSIGGAFNSYQIRYDSDGHISTFSYRPSVELIDAEPVVAAPPAPPTVFRHPNFEELTFFPLREAPPQLEPRRLILSQFYCIFRESGNASRVFPTLEEGTRAFPRATEWHERKVYSDGEIVEGPVNHG
jgi:hypothetical protein